MTVSTTPVTPSGQENGDPGQPTDNPTNNPNPESITTTEGSEDSSETPKPSAEVKFTQKDLDAAAAKARREEQAKLDKKKQEAQGEFEKLYQTEAQKAAALEQKLLIRDICDELEIPKDWRDSVTGTDEETIKASATSLKARLDKIVADAVKEQKITKPGTPPPSGDGPPPEDAAQKGKEKTKQLVLQAMGFQTPK